MAGKFSDNKDDILYDIKCFEDLLTERISDMYEIKGMMQARHCYIFYRKLLGEIKDKIKELKPNDNK